MVREEKHLVVALLLLLHPHQPPITLDENDGLDSNDEFSGSGGSGNSSGSGIVGLIDSVHNRISSALQGLAALPQVNFILAQC